VERWEKRGVPLHKRCGEIQKWPLAGRRTKRKGQIKRGNRSGLYVRSDEGGWDREETPLSVQGEQLPPTLPLPKSRGTKRNLFTSHNKAPGFSSEGQEYGVLLWVW